MGRAKKPIVPCVRGLLCVHCNHGLGSFKDNPEYLAKAAGYLGGSL